MQGNLLRINFPGRETIGLCKFQRFVSRRRGKGDAAKETLLAEKHHGERGET